MCICKDNLGFQTKEKKFHINAESGNDENQAQNVIKDSLIWNIFNSKFELDIDKAVLLFILSLQIE